MEGQLYASSVQLVYTVSESSFIVMKYIFILF